LLLTALVLSVGWIGLGVILWWSGSHRARLAERIEKLENARDADKR